MLLGRFDDPRFDPSPIRDADLARRWRGSGLGWTGAVREALFRRSSSRVTGGEAATAFRGLTQR
jgi:hypothetical protein